MNPSNTFKKEIKYFYFVAITALNGVDVRFLFTMSKAVTHMKTATETREYEPPSQKAADLDPQLQSYNPQIRRI